MINPACNKCNQLVYDENGNATHICVLKGYIEDIEKNWCSCFNIHWISSKEKEKKND